MLHSRPITEDPLPAKMTNDMEKIQSLRGLNLLIWANAGEVRWNTRGSPCKTDTACCDAVKPDCVIGKRGVLHGQGAVILR